MTEDFHASEDVWTRALPILALVFTVEMFGAMNLDWGLAANVLAIAGGAAVLLVAFGIANKLQGRPFASIPSRVGKPELVAFIAIPALLPLMFGGQWRSSLVTAMFNLLLLGTIYLVVGYGFFSILSWSARRLFSQLATSFQLLSRALPLVMVSSLILFFTAEMWQVFADLRVRVIVVVSALVLGLGALFIIVRIPAEVGKMLAHSGTTALSRRQRVNVGLVMFIAQALQIVLVVAGIAAFFIMLGSVAVTKNVQEAWTASSADFIVPEFEVWGVPFAITRQLLVVSGGIAALGGLYFSIAVLTDTTYREQFHEQLTDEMEETFRLRDEYLRVLKGGSPVAPEIPTG